jgi:hypothetical protein
LHVRNFPALGIDRWEVSSFIEITLLLGSMNNAGDTSKDGSRFQMWASPNQYREYERAGFNLRREGAVSFQLAHRYPDFNGTVHFAFLH